jgi:hypothetical protein
MAVAAMDASDGPDPPAPLRDALVYDREGHFRGYATIGCPVDELVRVPEPGEVLRIAIEPSEVIQMAFEVASDAIRFADGDLVIEVEGGQVVLTEAEEARPVLLDVNCDYLTLPPRPQGDALAFAAPNHPLAGAIDGVESVGLEFNPHG